MKVFIIALSLTVLTTSSYALEDANSSTGHSVDQQVKNQLSECELKLENLSLKTNNFRSSVMKVIAENQNKTSELSKRLYGKIEILEKEVAYKNSELVFVKSEYEKLRIQVIKAFNSTKTNSTDSNASRFKDDHHDK